MRYQPKYFSINELTRSTAAVQHKIANVPNETERANLLDLIEYTLDPIREMWGKPIKVNSGYRCRALNTLVGGARASSHMTGQAADLSVGGKSECEKLYEMIKRSDIPFTKVIIEHSKNYNYWVHVSYIKNSLLRKAYIYNPFLKSYILDKE